MPFGMHMHPNQLDVSLIYGNAPVRAVCILPMLSPKLSVLTCAATCRTTWC